MILSIVFVITATIFFYHVAKIVGICLGNRVDIPKVFGVDIEHWWISFPSTVFQIWFWATFFKVI